MSTAPFLRPIDAYSARCPGWSVTLPARPAFLIWLCTCAPLNSSPVVAASP